MSARTSRVRPEPLTTRIRGHKARSVIRPCPQKSRESQGWLRKSHEVLQTALLEASSPFGVTRQARQEMSCPSVRGRRHSPTASRESTYVMTLSGSMVICQQKEELRAEHRNPHR